MPEDVSVVEAPVEATEVPEISSTETPTEGSQSEPAQIDSGNEPQAGETGHLKGSELYRAVKDQLKTLDPKLARSVRNAIHIAAKADQSSGGDLTRFETERAAYSKLGEADDGLTPEQRVESVLNERNFWREFDDKFDKGDASLIKQMFESNPQSSQELIVHGINEFANVNPEGYSALIAKAVTGYFGSQNIPLQFQILDTFLPSMPDFPGKQQVVNAIQQIYAVSQKLDEMATKPLHPERKNDGSQQSQRIDSNPDRLAQREMDLNRREWIAETWPKAFQIAGDTVEQVASSQKVQLTDADRQKIANSVKEEFTVRLKADIRYGQAALSYLQAGNKKAWADRALSEAKKLLPSIARRWTQAVIDENKAKPKPQAQPAKAAPPVNGKVQANGSGQQVRWIAGHPKTQNMQIDLNRTTNGMLLRNEAYIKGSDTLHKWKPRTA